LDTSLLAFESGTGSLVEGIFDGLDTSLKGLKGLIDLGDIHGWAEAGVERSKVV
jgi:hypothetical protein